MLDSATVEAVDRAARTRRSVRDFRPDPIDLADVTRILEVGTMAPSAWNLQPWRFVVVTDPATKATLQSAAHGQRQVGQAPAVIVLYTDMVAALGQIDEALHPALPSSARATIRSNIEGTFAAMTPEARDQWGNAQGNILLGYLLLLFEVHGYATSPMLGFSPAAVRAALDLPEHAQIPALLAVGRAAGPAAGPPHRFAVDQIARFITGEG